MDKEFSSGTTFSRQLSTRSDYDITEGHSNSGGCAERPESTFSSCSQVDVVLANTSMLVLFIAQKEFVMSHNSLVHHVVHAISHQSQHERKHGNPGRANGLAMIGMGIVLMPLPIVGVPLLVGGLFKAVKG